MRQRRRALFSSRLLRRARSLAAIYRTMDSTLPDDDTTPELPLEPQPEASAPVAETPAETVPAESIPVEEAPADAAPAEAGEPASPKDTLTELAALAEKGRLSAADEARAAQAIKECLLDGRAGVTFVIELLPKFAWMVAVNGVAAAWPELTAGFRTQLFSGLSKDESDSARRLRLSLSRGLFKQDVPSAAKLAVGVARDLRDKESGALPQKDAQMFASVFIGRAKPWLAGFPLGDLKPADADALVHCALLTVFTLPHPPVTQLGVLKWAAEAGRLEKLHELALEAVKNGLGRWTAKWQAALQREVPGLPEGLAAVLTAPVSEPVENAPANGGNGDEPAADDAEHREQDDEEEDDEDRDEGAPKPPRQYPVYVSKTMPSREDAPAAPAPREPREPREPRGESREPREPAQQRESSRPPRGGQSAANLNVSESLRLIDAHVAFLRNELKTAQNKLKDRDGDRRSSRRPERSSAPIIEGEPTSEELARLNLQLEARNAELQSRLDDLTADSEDRAASSGIIIDQPVDPDAALRALLALKLQEDYEDFLALERETNDVVVQAHYRTLLRHIFEVLTHEGVGFKQTGE